MDFSWYSCLDEGYCGACLIFAMRLATIAIIFNDNMIVVFCKQDDNEVLKKNLSL